MTASNTDIIPKAATILQELAKKPHEQMYFTEDAIPILMDLKKRGLASQAYLVLKMPDHNVWIITKHGLDWLEKHGLLP